MKKVLICLISFSFFFLNIICAESMREAYGVIKEAESLAKQGEYNKAEEKIKYVLEKNPDIFLAYNMLAIIYTLQGGRENDAITVLKKSISLNPKQPKVYHSLGELYNALLIPEEAVFYFRKGLTYAPDDFSMNYSLGVTYFLGLHDLDNALVYAKKALDMRPENTKLIYINGVLNVYALNFPSVLEYITTLRSLGDEKSAGALEAAIKEHKPVVISQEDISQANSSSGAVLNTNSDNSAVMIGETSSESINQGKIQVTNPTQEITGQGRLTVETRFKPKD
ncbi:MAG: hypothetical protein PHP69_03220 [Candidatus Omnitrophica bacterium]|nr:hypothetical protein [Candidatus Omnitrophota bacterium]